MKKSNGTFFIYIVFIGLILYLAAMAYTNLMNEKNKTYSIVELMAQIENDEVSEIVVAEISGSSNSAMLTVTLKNEDTYEMDVLSFDSHDARLVELATEKGFSYRHKPVARPNYLSEVIMIGITIVIGILVFMFLFQQNQNGGGNRVMNFGKSRAKLATDDVSKITFKEVAGLMEEKVELQELVDFLKSPRKYIEIGARIPKGVLLVGPPGTGKTLLAKAVAGEAGVPFFSISGSDFVEMFVGVGASRVRDLFAEAKRNYPSIVFIDEIDAVGRRRGAGLGGGHDEREQTLNQLLVEMDGFGVNEGVIIIAATNRSDILDPALLRPGRFDRQVLVGTPDVKGREEILEVHAKGKKIGVDVDFKAIALSTGGFTGADIENLLNEAAILSARNNEKEISMEQVRRAFIKVSIGTEKRSRVVIEKERKLTAYHEAGHAVIFEILPEIDSVSIVSIIPVGSAGGFTMPIPSEELSYMSKKSMFQNIVAFYGGRVAEEIVLDDVSTGASNDIQRASQIARDMVMRYGMSDTLGPIFFSSESEQVFIGRDMSSGRNYGEDIAAQIDKEVKLIIDNAYNEAHRILSENMDVVHKAADLLLEKERITGEEFRALFPEGVLTKEIKKDSFTLETLEGM